MKKILIPILKKYKLQFVIVWTFIFINTYVFTLPPKIIGKIVDLLYHINENKWQIQKYILWLIAAAVGLLIARLPWKYAAGIISRGIERDLRNKLFGQFMRMKMANLQNIKNGELMSYFTKDIGEIRIFTYRVVALASRIVAVLLVAVYQMAAGVDIKLTLATLCPILITCFLVVKIKKYVEKSFRKSQKYYTSMSEFVQEATDSIRTTKAYTGEKSQLKEFIKRNRLLRQADNAVDIYSMLLATCINTCFGLCYGISLIYGSHLVLKRHHHDRRFYRILAAISAYLSGRSRGCRALFLISKGRRFRIID